MALDLTALSKQVRQMSGTLALGVSNQKKRIAHMRTIYLNQSGKESMWADMVDQHSKANPWKLLARPTGERFDMVRDADPCPKEHAIVATDGSQIEMDRHGIAAYYLLNIGQVYLHYGSQPTARLSSLPSLHYEEDDLYLTEGNRRIAMEGNYLKVWRDIQELVSLNDLSKHYLDGSIAGVALIDGTLMRWAVAGFEQFVRDRFLGMYLRSLQDMLRRDTPVASYISRPRASEVVNTISLMNRTNGDADAFNEDDHMDRNVSAEDDQDDSTMPFGNGLVDADVFFELLYDGQRGPLFVSMSRVNVDSYGPHCIHFFYMRVGREMARVEVPQWVAQNPAMVDLVHSLVYDQCIRGQGYPVALARAHEQAVVRGSDRRAFLRMVEQSLLRAELSAHTSSKQEQKEVVRC